MPLATIMLIHFFSASNQPTLTSILYNEALVHNRECHPGGYARLYKSGPFHLINSLQPLQRSSMRKRNLRVMYRHVSFNALFQFESNQLKPRQCKCHFADDISNLIILYEMCALFIQINYNSIKMDPLIITIIGPLAPNPGPEQTSYQLQMLWHLMRGVRQNCHALFTTLPAWLHFCLQWTTAR